MTWIKICGITRREDALLAAELGANAIGFVFAPSARRCAPREARAMKQDLGIPTVGVFVDATLEEIARVSDEADVDIVQLHGGEAPEFCARIARPVIKAFRGAPARGYRAMAALVDGPRNGVPFELSAIDVDLPLIVAGGLTAENVRDAIARFRPFGVDVSSGVESSPGKKDRTKLTSFVNKVRS